MRVALARIGMEIGEVGGELDIFDKRGLGIVAPQQLLLDVDAFRQATRQRCRCRLETIVVMMIVIVLGRAAAGRAHD